jgi:hypothetical protein
VAWLRNDRLPGGFTRKDRAKLAKERAARKARFKAKQADRLKRIAEGEDAARFVQEASESLAKREQQSMHIRGRYSAVSQP